MYIKPYAICILAVLFILSPLLMEYKTRLEIADSCVSKNSFFFGKAEYSCSKKANK